MGKKKYNTAENRGVWPLLRPLVIGLAAGTAAALLLLYAAAAVITWQGVLPEELLGGIVTVILCIASAAAGCTAAMISGSKGIVYGTGAGLLLTIAVLFGGIGLYAFTCTAQIIVKAVMMVLCTAIAGILTVNRKTKIKF